MSKTQVWDSVSRDQWTYTTKDSFLSLFVYKIQALPDFTSPRFEYLSKDQDNRPVEVAKKQMQMIRQFHAMGTQWAISLRLIKEEAITLYLIFRYAGSNKLTEPEQRNAKELYCRPPEFAEIQSGKYLAGGLQSDFSVNSIGVQYDIQQADI